MAPRSYKLSELAALIGATVDGDGDTVITGASGIREAREGDITFVASDAYDEHLATTRASAVVTTRDRDVSQPSIRVENPYLAFVKILRVLAADLAPGRAAGVHASAVVDDDAHIGAGAAVGPLCNVGPGARIGDNTTLLSGVYVGPGTTIGADCLIYPNVTIRENCELGDRVIVHPGAVIGSDGFGFAWDGAAHLKIPQIGTVVVEDDVEIGANTTIDRATTAVTRICRGTKIDNLVHVAHNCIVGKNTILAGQVGLSGSVELGEGVIMAGQVGCVGHIHIGDGVTAGAQAGITKSIPPGRTVSGYPAMEHGHARRVYAVQNQLPELYKRIRELEKKVALYEGGVDSGSPADDDQ